MLFASSCIAPCLGVCSVYSTPEGGLVRVGAYGCIYTTMYAFNLLTQDCSCWRTTGPAGQHIYRGPPCRHLLSPSAETAETKQCDLDGMYWTVRPNCSPLRPFDPIAFGFAFGFAIAYSLYPRNDPTQHSQSSPYATKPLIRLVNIRLVNIANNNRVLAVVSRPRVSARRDPSPHPC